MKGHISGERISRSHTTTTNLAREVAKLLNGVSHVSNISLGVIDARGGSRLKKVIMNKDDHSLRLTVLESQGKQELYVSSSNRNDVIRVIIGWAKTENVMFVIR